MLLECLQPFFIHARSIAHKYVPPPKLSPTLHQFHPRVLHPPSPPPPKTLTHPIIGMLLRLAAAAAAAAVAAGPAAAGGLKSTDTRRSIRRDADMVGCEGSTCRHFVGDWVINEYEFRVRVSTWRSIRRDAGMVGCEGSTCRHCGGEPCVVGAAGSARTKVWLAHQDLHAQRCGWRSRICTHKGVVGVAGSACTKV